MENTWFKYLDQFDLKISSERTNLRYIAHDWRSRKSYILGRQTAQAIYAVKNYIGGKRISEPTKDELQQAYAFSEHIRKSNLAEQTYKKPFNPLFMRFEFFNLGRFDVPLERIAKYVVPSFIIIFTLSLLLCLLLAFYSSGEIFTQTGTALNFNGLAIFVALSPFLKIFHELGHALTARYFRTRLRSFGILIVGLFPLPFVDCSMADMDANRRQRVFISLAGIIVDFWIASIAFILWHISTGDILKTVYMNIFVFSSLNSLLFNGNPLIRLDGYFAFSDLIGHRNLSSKSAQGFKATRTWITHMGSAGFLPSTNQARLYLIYGMMSAIYKTYILGIVAWLVLPKFFGIGIIIVIWAGLVMFGSPLLRAHNNSKPAKWNVRSVIFWALFICFLTAISFIQIPLKTTLSVSLDTQGTYAIRSTEAGVLGKTNRQRNVRKGEILYRKTNIALAEMLELAQLESRMLENAYANATGSNQNASIAFQNQLDALTSEIKDLKTRIESLTHKAPYDGRFYPLLDFVDAQFINTADYLGYILPSINKAILTADLNETYVEDFQNKKPNVHFWEAHNGPVEANGTLITLQLKQNVDTETGKRNFQLLFVAPMDPTSLNDKDLYAKLNFGSQPLYEHVKRWAIQLWYNYLDIRISDVGS